MKTKQFLLGLVFASLFGGLVAVGTFKLLDEEQIPVIQSDSQDKMKFSNFVDTEDFTIPAGLNFVYAAEVSTPAVVHIRSSYSIASRSGGAQDPLNLFDFFGQQRPRNNEPAGSSGSGVIISNDGYIVTNNHVIDNADDLQVTLDDNRRFNAKVIGTDPNTDLALIKIDEEDLPHLNFGNSDVVKVGEWVLAIGNPFDLTSTVTAGIVSARARNINILRRNYGIESFIQTDAAVNPGNSGGALVNLKGELIGINTAIATQTGSYAGYSFAVPVSLVRKVVEDLKEFGVVQRAILGINISDINADLAEQEGLDEVSGVFIANVNQNSAAEEAGLEKGDVVVAINDVKISNTSELQEQVALNRPGDKIKVKFLRKGKSRQVFATLKNVDSNYKRVEKSSMYELAGATFEDLDDDDLDQYGLRNGVKITEIDDGKWKDAGIQEGFIVTRVDKQPVQNADRLTDMLRAKKGGTLIEGVYPNGQRAYYAMGW